MLGSQKSRSRVLAVTLAAIAAVLAGCAPQERPPTVVDGLTVEQAKAHSQEWEMRIAALVPPADVAEVKQVEFGTLRSCEEERVYRWTGTTFVYLTRELNDAEADALTEGLATKLTDEAPDHTVTTSNASEHLAVELFGTEGEVYTASTRPKGMGEEVGVVTVTSASPCFVLPDDLYPGGQF